MKTTIKDNVLHNDISRNASRPSSSGKTLTVASSNDSNSANIHVNGLSVIVGTNDYLKPEH